MSALPAGDTGPGLLVPYWLSAAERAALGSAVRTALTCLVHPVAALHLQEVLTELHVAAARDAVWPATAARVRSATGWSADVLPVRLSAAERGSVLDIPELPTAVRDCLARAGS